MALPLVARSGNAVDLFSRDAIFKIINTASPRQLAISTRGLSSNPTFSDRAVCLLTPTPVERPG